MMGISYRIDYDNVPSILSWIDSGGVLEVKKMSTLDGTTFLMK